MKRALLLIPVLMTAMAEAATHDDGVITGVKFGRPRKPCGPKLDRLVPAVSEDEIERIFAEIFRAVSSTHPDDGEIIYDERMVMNEWAQKKSVGWRLIFVQDRTSANALILAVHKSDQRRYVIHTPARRARILEVILPQIRSYDYDVRGEIDREPPRPHEVSSVVL